MVTDHSHHPVLAQGRLASAADAVGGDQGAELAPPVSWSEETDKGPVHREASQKYKHPVVTY